jgi:hypothetical protein
MDKNRKGILAGVVVLAIVASSILGTGLIKTTINKDGWSGYGSPGMLMVVIFGAWVITTTVRSIKR